MPSGQKCFFGEKINENRKIPELGFSLFALVWDKVKIRVGSRQTEFQARRSLKWIF